MAQAVFSGHIAGNGPFSKKCHEFLESHFRTHKVLLTHSGTAALEMAAILSEAGSGDEVILPSFTFVSTANAFYSRGARPVFVDIKPDNLNIDETKIEEAVTAKTRAIIPVHYAGVACDMDSITDLAAKNRLRVIEDAAQAVGSSYNGKHLGTIGDLGAFSFHETKNHICGEGGALLINNPEFRERAEIIWEKGTNRNQFFRGEVDRYTWLDVGSSYLMSDLLAAFLYAQLEEMEKINHRRREIYNRYYDGLAPLRENGRLTLPVRLPGEVNGHLFHLLLNTGGERDGLMYFLRERGIYAIFHYLPLHLSPVGLSLGYRKGQLPVTESICSRLLRLPFYFELKRKDQERVIESIYDFFK